MESMYLQMKISNTENYHSHDWQADCQDGSKPDLGLTRDPMHMPAMHPMQSTL